MNPHTSDVIRFLRDYVAIPSVNPMGRTDIDASIAGELRYAEHLQQQLRAMGADARLVGHGARRSVVAELTVTGASDTLMVASHLDTVPVDGMSIDPFDPVVKHDRVHGRGACDTKAGMAALMAALKRVLQHGTLRRNLVVVGEADEELSSVGVQDVLDHLGGRNPNWVLVTEPTELRLVNRHKGIAVVRLEAQGRACHSSAPDAGYNAIMALARALGGLEGLSRELATRSHPHLGPPTLSVGVVGGGDAPNIVPRHAWALVDRRMLPGETADSVAREFAASLAQSDDTAAVAIASCQVEKDPLETNENHFAVATCQRLLQRLGRDHACHSVAFGTDAGPLAVAGIPGVVLGPGSIAQAHTAAEYVEIEQVEAMEELFVSLLESDTDG